MKVFSKRYSSREYIRLRRHAGPLTSARHYTDRHGLLESNLRIRLNQEIKYLVSSGEYIEPFLLTHYSGEKAHWLNAEALARLSYQELGYDLTEYYSSDDLIPIKKKTDEGERYLDKYFLDLVEILIIFSKDEKREEVINRLQKILKEENSDLLIYGHMIIIEDAGGLQSMSALLSDKMLRNKLEDILLKGLDTSIAAREAADITQYVFSGKTKGSTKKDSEEIINKIANRWLATEDQEGFKKLLNDTVKNIKSLNNQMKNIRHTDRYTIDFQSPDIYKMIKQLNLAVSEMAILSTQDDFIETEKTSSLKDNYLKGYGINNAVNELIPELSIDEIDF